MDMAFHEGWWPCLHPQAISGKLKSPFRCWNDTAPCLRYALFCWVSAKLWKQIGGTSLVISAILIASHGRHQEQREDLFLSCILIASQCLGSSHPFLDRIRSAKSNSSRTTAVASEVSSFATTVRLQIEPTVLTEHVLKIL